MKTKNHQNKSIHQYVEQVLRHKASLVIVIFLMFAAMVSFDARLRGLMQEAYAQGWGWVGTYLHHEHPAHLHGTIVRGRAPTISGSI